ncbi:hypothetical protein PPERSA_10036 [Pseudocohnilembus persalinus]|uniref:C2H2-type domain-containing protein n=1 Tax=Pseudocohnilembus persalinus TaxID=266149 RepID=A0A0V0QJB9_PSEPJ|nr:hypothetical protein PPERSA_10036 [Pseudocohnilembus persalinus]|eukprot:KRX02419.1 hypothetical protein PPERSA_10036 [Pseudocohnilembus persalinus]
MYQLKSQEQIFDQTHLQLKPNILLWQQEQIKIEQEEKYLKQLQQQLEQKKKLQQIKLINEQQQQAYKGIQNFQLQQKQQNEMFKPKFENVKAETYYIQQLQYLQQPQIQNQILSKYQIPQPRDWNYINKNWQNQQNLNGLQLPQQDVIIQEQSKKFQNQEQSNVIKKKIEVNSMQNNNLQEIHVINVKQEDSQDTLCLQQQNLIKNNFSNQLKSSKVNPNNQNIIEYDQLTEQILEKQVKVEQKLENYNLEEKMINKTDISDNNQQQSQYNQKLQQKHQPKQNNSNQFINNNNNNNNLGFRIDQQTKLNEKEKEKQHQTLMIQLQDQQIIQQQLYKEKNQNSELSIDQNISTKTNNSLPQQDSLKKQKMYINNQEKEVKVNKKNQKVFQCEKCDYSTIYLQNYKRHFIKAHPQTEFKCQICEIQFKDKKQLIEHNNENHLKKLQNKQQKQNSSVIFFCEDCDYQTKFEKLLKRHVEANHGNELVKCHFKNCKFQTTVKRYLNQHLQYCHSVEELKCDKCNFKSENPQSMYQHKRHMHNNNVYKCEQCNFQTKNEKNINIHRKNMHQDINYQCQHCDFNSKNQDYFKRHLRNFHPDFVSEEKK